MKAVNADNFYDWVVSKYTGKDSPRGDFAGDIKNDPCFPKMHDGDDLSNYYGRILNYLWLNNACTGCIDVFKKLWRDWKRCKRKKEVNM